jgi:hypothetical protein
MPPTAAELKATVNILAEQLAELRRHNPINSPSHASLIKNDNGLIPDELKERFAEAVNLDITIAWRRKKEEEPEYIAKCALHQAQTKVWLDQHPTILSALTRATDQQVKAQLDKCDELSESEKFEISWEFQEMGAVAVILFGQVGWFHKPDTIFNIPRVVIYNNGDDEWLAKWDEENGVFKLMDYLVEE